MPFWGNMQWNAMSQDQTVFMATIFLYGSDKIGTHAQ